MPRSSKSLIPQATLNTKPFSLPQSAKPQAQQHQYQQPPRHVNNFNNRNSFNNQNFARGGGRRLARSESLNEVYYQSSKPTVARNVSPSKPQNVSAKTQVPFGKEGDHFKRNASSASDEKLGVSSKVNVVGNTTKYVFTDNDNNQRKDCGAVSLYTPDDFQSVNSKPLRSSKDIQPPRSLNPILVVPQRQQQQQSKQSSNAKILYGQEWEDLNPSPPKTVQQQPEPLIKLKDVQNPEPSIPYGQEGDDFNWSVDVPSAKPKVAKTVSSKPLKPTLEPVSNASKPIAAVPYGKEDDSFKWSCDQKATTTNEAERSRRESISSPPCSMIDMIKKVKSEHLKQELEAELKDIPSQVSALESKTISVRYLFHFAF